MYSTKLRFTLQDECLILFSKNHWQQKILILCLNLFFNFTFLNKIPF